MKLVMFDLDGTLYRTETSFFPAVRRFADRYGFAVPEEEFLRGFIGQNSDYWRTWIDQLHLGVPTDTLLQDFDALERPLIEECGQLYAGADGVLRELASNGWTLGICSNAPAWYPELILSHAGLRQLFQFVRTPSRPDETKAMLLCTLWNELHPDQCAMVGDRADDMQAAHAAGFLAIGAAYGWAPDELQRADVLIHGITEVSSVLAGARPAPESIPDVREATAGGPAQQVEPVSAAVSAQPAPTAVPLVEHVPETASPHVTETPQESTVSAESAPQRGQSASSGTDQPEPVTRRSWNPFRRQSGTSH